MSQRDVWIAGLQHQPERIDVPPTTLDKICARPRSSDDDDDDLAENREGTSVDEVVNMTDSDVVRLMRILMGSDPLPTRACSHSEQPANTRAEVDEGERVQRVREGHQKDK